QRLLRIEMDAAGLRIVSSVEQEWTCGNAVMCLRCSRPRQGRQGCLFLRAGAMSHDVPGFAGASSSHLSESLAVRLLSSAARRPQTMPEPIRVKHIDHVTVVVKNLEKSRAFYVDVLGMQEVPRPGFRFP